MWLNRERIVLAHGMSTRNGGRRVCVLTCSTATSHFIRIAYNSWIDNSRNVIMVVNVHWLAIECTPTPFSMLTTVENNPNRISAALTKWFFSRASAHFLRSVTLIHFLVKKHCAFRYLTNDRYVCVVTSHSIHFHSIPFNLQSKISLTGGVRVKISLVMRNLNIFFVDVGFCYC